MRQLNREVHPRDGWFALIGFVLFATLISVFEGWYVLAMVTWLLVLCLVPFAPPVHKRPPSEAVWMYPPARFDQPEDTDGYLDEEPEPEEEEPLPNGVLVIGTGLPDLLAAKPGEQGEAEVRSDHD